ncbi:Hypothetical Protein FCC1311_050822 [Hondaea fermentalgiana]|uniref:Sphingomyelin synthase-like domain-containing protein n=1 Tax=Hondaea fermentalgiana TaxID=2315210 RepID=A0A2R5GKQ7_9STRA|nr:Hypothetical Protein FCC1311_050822 [Hondaea fermentalgiana]|eukprot:GBG28861.1 Hypothetical Protein FCC1311_050822 [Hondaea fermentalgiana]
MLSLDHLESPWARSLRMRGLCVGLFVGVGGMYLGFVMILVAHRAFGDKSFVERVEHATEAADAAGATGSATPTAPTASDEPECMAHLIDVGFYVVPEWGAPEFLEVWVLVAVLITLLRFTFSSALTSTILRRWFFLTGVLSVCRGLARVLTLRPPTTSVTACEIQDQPDVSVFWVALSSYARQASNCVDVVFALHVVHLTLASLVWLYYVESAGPLGVSANIVRFVVILYCFAGYMLVLSTRAHYTADLFVWSSFTAAIWVMYHHWVVLLRLDALGMIGSEFRYSRKNILAAFVLWFEAGAEDLYFASAFESPSRQLGAEGSHHLSLYSSTPHPSQLSLSDDPEFDEGFDDAGPHVVFDSSSTQAQAGLLPSPSSDSMSLKGYESFGKLGRPDR